MTTARRHRMMWIVALLLAPGRAAWALCPACLGQARALSAKQGLLGVFLLVPFVVALVVARRIRRQLMPAAHRASPPAASTKRHDAMTPRG